MGIEAEFVKDIAARFNWAFVRVNNAVNQLDDQQLWHRPSSKSNSVGIILQHLTGNLNQWVLDALGGREYKRNRPLEFEDSQKRSRSEIAAGFAALGTSVQEVVLKIDPDSLLTPCRIQETDQTILSALLSAITHMDLHTGQILYIAKMLLNERYVEARRVTKP